MSELFATSILAGVVTSIVESLFKGNGSIIAKINAHRRKESTKNRINGIPSEYKEKFSRRHGRVKFIGKNEPIDVNLVFTDIEYIDSKVSFQINDSLQTLETQFRDERRPSKNQAAERKSVFDIAKTTQHLMLLGGPGAGKTTFLRKVGMEALGNHGESSYGHDYIPVFIELKRFNSKNESIENLIQEEFEISGIPDSLEFTQEALNTGKLLILLDGLDEIPYSNLEHALVRIKDFVDKYSTNRYIASCREAAKYHGFLTSFTDIQIADFSNSQIKKFVDIWFQTESEAEDDSYERKRNLERGKSFLKILDKEKNFAVRELARNPLLLTLLCLVYQSSNNLPNNRVSLFQQALELFINKWFALKKIQPNPILDQEFDPILEKAMLSEVAYRGFTLNRVFFSERELVGHIRAYMEENLNAPDLDSQEVLTTIKIYQGILIDQVQSYCSFSHVAFQEYLTAQYIYDNKKVCELIKSHIADKRWKEVFSMVSGLLISSSDELLQLMEKESRKFISSQRLNDLVTWSEFSIAQRTRSFEKRLIFCTERREWRTLESYSWRLIIRHAATFYLLGTLLGSYVNALRDYADIEMDFNINMDLSNLFKKYSSSIISEVYEYLSTKSISKEDLENIGKLISSIKKIGIISRSIIKIEPSKYNLAKASKLRKQFRQAKIFHCMTPGPIWKNIEMLKQRENLSRKYSGEENKALVTKMWRNWLQSLGLVPYDVMNMTKAEIVSLENYLYINHLIINCRIRAVKVSPEAWNNILLNMMRRTKGRIEA